MRAVLLILIVAVVALIVAISSGWLHLSQTREARLPQVQTNGVAVTTKGGQSPSFEVETGSVAIGSRQANVSVPSLRVIPPDDTPANSAAANTH